MVIFADDYKIAISEKTGQLFRVPEGIMELKGYMILPKPDARYYYRKGRGGLKRKYWSRPIAGG
jgi:hypothetical protein